MFISMCACRTLGCYVRPVFFFSFFFLYVTPNTFSHFQGTECKILSYIFFCLRNFKVAIQGYRYQSWIASVLVKLESYYKSAKQRPVSRRILVVYWFDIDVYAWQHFFSRELDLRLFFQYFYCIPRRSATEFLRMVPQK